MPEELGTRDVLEQVDARLNNVEQDIRAMRSEMDGRFDQVHREIGGLRSDIRSEFGSVRSEMVSEFGRIRSEMVSQGRWLVGLILASWLTLMASIWLKP